MSVITLTTGDDTFAGTVNADIVDGLDGNDTLNLAGGDDVAYGGNGNDLLNGDDGNDTLYGGAGDNVLFGGMGNDVLYIGDGGAVGNLSGGTGNDTLYGGNQQDYFDVSDGGDDVAYGFGDTEDRLFIGDVVGQVLNFDSSATGDQLTGGTVADRVAAFGFSRASLRADNATINGGDGNDFFSVEILTASTINGGAGDDDVQLYGDTASPVGGYINGGDGNDFVIGFDADDTIIGDDGNDFLIGRDGNDSLTGGGGNDTLDGEDGNDVIYGGAGTDRLRGGDGNDVIYGGDDTIDGADFLYGGSGDDTLYGGNQTNFFYVEDGGSDVVYGKAGDQLNLGVVTNDLFEFDSASAGDQLTLGTGGIGERISAFGFNTLRFTADNSTISGASGNESFDVTIAGASTIDAGLGNDTMLLNTDTVTPAGALVYGRAGDDNINLTAGNNTVYGGAGTDFLSNGAGVDYIDGGNDDDFVSVIQLPTADTLIGGTGTDFLSFGIVQNANLVIDTASSTDQLSGGVFGDGIVATEFERFSTTLNNATITGGSGDEYVQTSIAASSVIYGGEGHDTIVGFSTGGAGLLYGGEGNDSLIAGSATIVNGTGANAVTLQGGLGDDVFQVGDGATVADLTEDDVLAIGPDTATLSALTVTDNGTDLVLGISVDGGATTSINLSMLAGFETSDFTISGNRVTLTPVPTPPPVLPPAPPPAPPTTITPPDVPPGGTQTTNTIGGATVITTVAPGTNGAPPTVTLTIQSSTDGDAQVTLTEDGIVSATVSAGVGVQSTGPQSAVEGDAANAFLQDAINGGDDASSPAAINQAALNLFGQTLGEGGVTVRSLQLVGDNSGEPITLNLDGGVDGTGSNEAFVIDFRSNANGANVTINNIEFGTFFGESTVIGGEGSGVFAGDDAAQTIILGPGDDTTFGGGGDDVIGSTTGNDWLYGEDGADTVTGGEDGDFVYGNVGADIVYGNQADDRLFGGQGDDVLFGGQDADHLFGNRASDIAYGNRGDDVLYGNAEADTLFGGQGNDALFGGQGDDRLFGGQGNDTLAGNFGADRFEIAASGARSGDDVIADFSRAEGDVITGGQFSALSAVSAVADGLVLTAADGSTLTLIGVASLDEVAFA